MPLRFNLSSRLPPLLFRTTSVLGMMWMNGGDNVFVRCSSVFLCFCVCAADQSMRPV